jgi:hypothetical protein
VPEALCPGYIGVKGTKTAAAADVRGNFKITIPAESSTWFLQVLGTSQSENRIDDFISIVLMPAVGQLNEVVVTGLVQSQYQKLACIQEVKGDELAEANTVNVVNSLQEKFPAL